MKTKWLRAVFGVAISIFGQLAFAENCPDSVPIGFNGMAYVHSWRTAGLMAQSGEFDSAGSIVIVRCTTAGSGTFPPIQNLQTCLGTTTQYTTGVHVLIAKHGKMNPYCNWPQIVSDLKADSLFVNAFPLRPADKIMKGDYDDIMSTPDSVYVLLDIYPTGTSIVDTAVLSRAFKTFLDNGVVMRVRNCQGHDLCLSPVPIAYIMPLEGLVIGYMTPVGQVAVALEDTPPNHIWPGLWAVRRSHILKVAALDEVNSIVMHCPPQPVMRSGRGTTIGKDCGGVSGAGSMRNGRLIVTASPGTSCTLLSPSGRVAKIGQRTGNAVAFDTRTLTPGSYLLRISGPGGETIRKIIVGR